MHSASERSVAPDRVRSPRASRTDNGSVNDAAVQWNGNTAVKAGRIMGQGRLALELERQCPFEQFGSKSLAPRRHDSRPSPLSPVKDQLGAICGIVDPP